MDPAADSVGYDLSQESPPERVAVTEMLVDAGVPHAWAENFELRVPAAQEDAVDRLFAELPEEPEDLSPEEEALSYVETPAGTSADELTVEALSRLFDVADRLMHRPSSRGAIRDLGRLKSVVLLAGVPTGLAAGWWGEVQRVTERLGEAVRFSPTEDEVRDEARRLRELLRDHV